MAKNEAKIRFTAETGEFNNQIKQSNSEMTKLRAEMKLNDEQMKTAGKSVEGLQQKQKLLEAQLTASRQKTEALSQKVQAAAEIYGENSEEVKKLQTQLLTAQAAEERLSRQVSACTDELESQKAAENAVKTATEQLTDRIESQQSELNKLKDEYKEAVLKFGETSDEAKDLAGNIDILSTQLKENKKEMNDADEAADKLDKSLDDASDNDGSGFTVFKGALSDLISNGIQFAISKINELIGYMAGLPEQTREIRQDFATLITAFDEMGYSSEVATETWKGLYGVFGEDDRAVETANHIAKIAQNEKELNDWITITKGIWATYQDSLPVEGLAEAANETAKVGVVTGGLADALNWAAVDMSIYEQALGKDTRALEEFTWALEAYETPENAFNAALATMYTEEERVAAITKVLTGLYGEAAVTYDKTSGSMIAAKEAAAENIIAENNLATAIEPVTTKWNELTNQLKTALLPVAQQVSQWAISAMEWMQQHPTLTKAIAAAVAVLSVGITGLAAGWAVYTAAQWAANSAMLASPITWIVLAIVAAIAALVAIIIVVVEKWDEIVAAVQNAAAAIWETIQNVWNDIIGFFSSIGNWIYENVIEPVADFFIDLWDNLKSGAQAVVDFFKSVFSTIANWVNQNVIQPVTNVFTGLWNGTKNGIQEVVDFFKSVFSTIASWVSQNIIEPVTNLFTGLWDSFQNGAVNAWNGVKQTFSNVASFFGDTFKKAWQKVKNVFSTGGKIFDGIKDGIVTSFKKVVNAIIKGINKVVTLPFKGLNKILDKLQSISVAGVKPFSWITWRAPIPQIPLLAKGGILTKPTLNVAGEAGPEAIIPINKLQKYISGAFQNTMQSLKLPSLFRMYKIHIQKESEYKSEFTGVFKNTMKSLKLPSLLNMYKKISKGNEVTIKGAVGWNGNIIDFIKEFFGENSHSVMRNEVGKELAISVAQGIAKNAEYAGKSAEEISKAILDAAQTKLDTYKTYNEMTLADEVAFWDEVRKQCKEGTEARISADKQYFDAKQSLNDEIIKAEEKVKQAFDDIDNRLNEQADSLREKFDIFEEFEPDEAISGEQMLRNIEKQTGAMQSWEFWLGNLEQRIGGTRLFDEIASRGVSALNQVRELLGMTEQDMQKLVDAYEMQNITAEIQAKEQLKDEVTQSLQNLADELTTTFDKLGISIDLNWQSTEMLWQSIEGLKDILQTSTLYFQEPQIISVADKTVSTPIIPMTKLQSYISGSVEKTMQATDLQSIIRVLENLANRPVELSINGQKFAAATAADADIVNGSRMLLSKRGLAR